MKVMRRMGSKSLGLGGTYNRETHAALLQHLKSHDQHSSSVLKEKCG
jgi:hypothetical protein